MTTASLHDQSRTEGASELQDLRILVVDDNQDIRILFGLYLAQCGLEYRAARDGAEALRMAESFWPDIVLLDIEMRGLDGYQVAHRLVEAGRPRPWLVAMTGRSGQAHAEQARTAGFNCLLAKPFRLDDLDAVLQALCRFQTRGRVTDHACTVLTGPPQHDFRGRLGVPQVV